MNALRRRNQKRKRRGKLQGQRSSNVQRSNKRQKQKRLKQVAKKLAGAKEKYVAQVLKEAKQGKRDKNKSREKTN